MQEGQAGTRLWSVIRVKFHYDSANLHQKSSRRRHQPDELDAHAL